MEHDNLLDGREVFRLEQIRTETRRTVDGFANELTRCAAAMDGFTQAAVEIQKAMAAARRDHCRGGVLLFDLGD